MSIRDYIEHLRAKPTHVRQNIALGVSTAVTLVVLVGWAVALSASEVLVFESENAASTTLTDATEGTSQGFSNLIGAAGAFQEAIEGAPPISVVETSASSTLDTPDTSEATVIPF